MRRTAVQAERRVSVVSMKVGGSEYLPGQLHPATALIGRPSCFVRKESENRGEMCELV